MTGGLGSDLHFFCRVAVCGAFWHRMQNGPTALRLRFWVDVLIAVLRSKAAFLNAMNGGTRRFKVG